MRFFTTQKTFTIKRQTFTGDKSVFDAVSGTFSGYLRQIDGDKTSDSNNQFGITHTLDVEATVDIREADKVTIASKEYTVQSVNTAADWFAVPFKKAFLKLSH